MNAGVATATVNATSGKSAEETFKKTMMNMSFAGVGSASNMLAPKIARQFGISSKLAKELVEESLNAAGAAGITVVSGGEYGKNEALVDFVTGMVMARIAHVKTDAFIPVQQDFTAAVNEAKSLNDIASLSKRINTIADPKQKDLLQKIIHAKTKSTVLSSLETIQLDNKAIFKRNVDNIKNGVNAKTDISVLPEGSIIKLYENGLVSADELSDIFSKGAGLISRKDFNYFASKKMKLTAFDTPEIIEARYFNAVGTPVDVNSSYYQEIKAGILKTESQKIAQAASEGKMIIVTGLPGAGKSTVVREVLGQDLMNSYYSPDADIFKEAFSDTYAAGKGAGLVHKASTTVLKQDIMPDVLKQRKNLIYQTTGGEETLNKIIEQAKQNNYNVEIIHVNIEPEMSMQRALHRFDKDGRFLDPYVTLGINNEGSFVPNQIPEMMKTDSRLSSITVYDTNGKMPKFIEKIETK